MSEENMEKQLASLERAHKYLSKDINNSQIKDSMLKTCIPECKIEIVTLTEQIAITKPPKLKITYTTKMGLEPTFR